MQDFFIYGKHPTFILLQNQKRKIKKIYTSNYDSLIDFINENKINIDKNIIEKKSNQEITKILKEDVNHQGFLVIVSERKNLDLDDFIKNECRDKNNLPKLIILDQLTDPHNIGAIIRTALAFGVKYIITTKFNSAKDSAIITKTSTGLSEMIELVEVVNLNRAIEELKKVGYFVIGMAGEAKTNLKTIKDSENLCLVVGNEGNGIRQLVKKNCDILAKIEMDKNVESLNVSVATAIAIYQLWA